MKPIVSPTPPPMRAPILSKRNVMSRGPMRETRDLDILHCASCREGTGTYVRDNIQVLPRNALFCQIDGSPPPPPCLAGGGGIFFSISIFEQSGLLGNER